MTNLSPDRPKWRQRFSRERVLIGAPVVTGLVAAIALAVINRETSKGVCTKGVFGLAQAGPGRESTWRGRPELVLVAVIHLARPNNLIWLSIEATMFGLIRQSSAWARLNTPCQQHAL